jgi:DNA-binding response OmpR family regulator
VYAFEGFRLDARPIVLTARLLDALLYFVEHGGQLLTKEELLEAIWPNVIVEEHNLNKTVCTYVACSFWIACKPAARLVYTPKHGA